MLGLGGASSLVSGGRWQVTLCDPIWQVTPRSSELTCQEELYHLTLTLTKVPVIFHFGMYVHHRARGSVALL